MSTLKQTTIPAGRRNFFKQACVGIGVLQSGEIALAEPATDIAFTVTGDGAQRVEQITVQIFDELERRQDHVQRCVGGGTVSINTAPRSLQLSEAKRIVNAVRNGCSFGDRFLYCMEYNANAGDEIRVTVSLTSDHVKFLSL